MARNFLGGAGHVSNVFGAGQAVWAGAGTLWTGLVVVSTWAFTTVSAVMDQGWGAVFLAGLAAASAASVALAVLLFAFAALAGAIRRIWPIPTSSEMTPRSAPASGPDPGEKALNGLRAELADLRKSIPAAEARTREFAQDADSHLAHEFNMLHHRVGAAINRIDVEARVQAAMRLACIRLLTLRMVEDVLREAPRLPNEAEEAGMTESQFSALQGAAAEFVSQARIELKATAIMERLTGDLPRVENLARVTVKQMPPDQRPAGVDALVFQDYRIAVARFRHIVDELSAYRAALARELGEPLETLNDMRTIYIGNGKSVQS